MYLCPNPNPELFSGCTDWPFVIFLMMAFLWRTSFRPPSMVCISVIKYTFIITDDKQQYQSFPLPWFGLVGLEVGVTEPVLGHRKYEIVLLVVNDYFVC